MNKKICVVVDNGTPEDRFRKSYWKQIIGNEVEYSELSFGEATADGELRDLEEVSILIVSWDTINGDPLGGADRALHYFRTVGKFRVRQLLQRGGIVFAEFQTVMGYPIQDAYDALFGPQEFSVHETVLHVDERHGTHAVPNRRRWLREEYFVPGTANARNPLHGNIKNERDADLFRFGKRYSKNAVSRNYPAFWHQDALWFGWFKWWSKDWLPLLWGQLGDGQYRQCPNVINQSAPVLLVKTAYGGLMIASTMWPSKAKFADATGGELVDRLLALDVEDIKRALARIHTRRKRIDTFLTLSAVLFVVACAWPLFWVYENQTVKPTAKWLSLILSAVSIGAFTIASLVYRFWKPYIWERPLGLSPIAAWRCRKNRASSK